MVDTPSLSVFKVLAQALTNMIYLGQPRSGQAVGIDDPRRSLPTENILHSTLFYFNSVFEAVVLKSKKFLLFSS